MQPRYPQSYGSFQDRWNSLTTTQKIFVGIAGLILLYAFLGGVGIFGRLMDPGYLVAVATIIFVAFPVHEFAHAAMAVKLGDQTPEYQGRYTLNPLVHIDPMGAVLILFTGFGWAKPVQWNPRNVSIDPKVASILVSLAGPISNLVLAVIAMILWSSFLPQIDFVRRFIDFFVFINVLLFVFNLIPIPPLDGSHVLFALLPDDLYQFRVILGQYGMLLLLVIIFAGSQIILAPTVTIIEFLSGIFL
ncbi:MAG: site-2 protease family protein [Chloroflexota bacterium]